MKTFHSSEARVLKDRALYTVDNDLPFRMGFVYAKATMWCLEYADRPELNDCEELPNNALEFFNNVAEPLSSLSTAHADRRLLGDS